MRPFTLSRNFHKQEEIDVFSSIIWTERYYGDSEVELVVPATTEMFSKLPLGIFLGLDKSDEIMILETMDMPEQGKLKFTGISLLKWLNNRFVRTSNLQSEQSWGLEGVPGKLLWDIVFNMCCEGSPYLDGTEDTGILHAGALAIPGLTLYDYDNSDESTQWTVPYGPVYDALKSLATTYEIGMQIVLGDVTDTSYSLGFRSYKGLDRTSGQVENQPVRFSPHVDSLTNIKELQSIAELTTLVYAFATNFQEEVMTESPAGIAALSGSEYTGFDLRALLLLTSDITQEALDSDPANLQGALNSRAYDALTTNSFIATVDGETVPTNQFKYGVHYNLGDIIEMQGNSNIISISRITEYIRAQDEAGERAYPTVEKIESEIA